jgi:hypothetical protein
MSKPLLTKWPWLWKLRLFLGLIFLMIVLVFLYFKVVPGGRAAYDLQWPRGLASGRGFIYNFQPGLRIDTADKTGLKIIADPVYFTLFTPRAFDQATVTVTYLDKLGTSTPLIELGVLKDKLSGSYELQPLQNNILDNYRQAWPSLTNNQQLLILQAQPQYTSAVKFLADLSAGTLRGCQSGSWSCLAVYNYPVTPVFQLPANTSFSPLTITQPLRGAHQFYVYLPRGHWRLNFNFVDLNQDRGADPITVNVWSGAKLIATQTLADNQAAAAGQAENRQLALNGTISAAGDYKVEVKINNDVVIKKISSSSDHLAFINKIWPVSGSGSLKLFTDSPILQAETSNPASLGNIIWGGQSYALDQTYQQFSWHGRGGITEIDLKHDDIILSNNGVFALTAAGLINPGVPKIDRYFTAGSSTKYIVAAYQPPREVGDKKTAIAVFDLRGAVREKGYYTWVISVPGLTASSSAAVNHYLEIKEIKIEVAGKTLWQKIW